MAPRRVLVLALATQVGLMGLAAWLSWTLEVPLQLGSPARDAGIGLLVAVGLAIANYALLRRGPDSWMVNGVRAVYRETLVPLFGGLGPGGVVLLGAAAGVGEEWLFRGVLQPTLGLAVTTLLFGAAHVGGVRMLSFGVWAAGMGLVMGLLTEATGGVTAAMVAHAVYDVMALEYIRRGARRG
jgi:membrane protease YdiL (CAAX protease family)